MNSGVRLLAVLVFSACASPGLPPPPMGIFHPDGVGGMQGSTKDGVRKNLLPSETLNMWCSPADDMKNFSNWCYDATATTPPIPPTPTPAPTPNPLGFTEWPPGLE